MQRSVSSRFSRRMTFSATARKRLHSTSMGRRMARLALIRLGVAVAAHRLADLAAAAFKAAFRASEAVQATPVTFLRASLVPLVGHAVPVALVQVLPARRGARTWRL